jgi:hypothetical protein
MQHDPVARRALILKYHKALERQHRSAEGNDGAETRWQQCCDANIALAEAIRRADFSGRGLANVARRLGAWAKAIRAAATSSSDLESFIDIGPDALESYAAQVVKGALRSESSEEIRKGLVEGAGTFGEGLVATVGKIANLLADRAYKAAIKTAPPARRICYKRDHHWLKQHILEDLGPTAIKDRWNEAHPTEKVGGVPSPLHGSP